MFFLLNITLQIVLDAKYVVLIRRARFNYKANDL